MENKFEIYKILASGIPVPVHEAADLEKAILAALHFAVHVRGHYTVCFAPNATEPILDVNCCGPFEFKEKNECQTFTRN